jgi:2-polyprenyl-3-methyl-5-hydroxy-6-metoxy-1,4-benzoquinol methylase
MKYYYREHIDGYEQVKAGGHRAWHTRFNGKPFDDFCSRPFLEYALPRLELPEARPRALEVGCGTGVGACFLVERGFQVDAIDLIPAAIEIAREVAAERGLDINYQVQDVCDVPPRGDPYGLIVDSFCLQAIVFDEERTRVFAAVRARLRPGGYYLVSTAMFDTDRFRQDETVTDERTGLVYHRYGDTGLIEAATGIAYVELEECPGRYEGSTKIAGVWYLPSRRHHRPPALKAELEQAGFAVLYQGGEYGENVICTLA